MASNTPRPFTTSATQPPAALLSRNISTTTPYRPSSARLWLTRWQRRLNSVSRWRQYVPLSALALRPVFPPSARSKMSAEPASEIAVDEFERQRQVSRQLAAPALEGYEIVGYIGEGTYGDVWQARELKTG